MNRSKYTQLMIHILLSISFLVAACSPVTEFNVLADSTSKVESVTDPNKILIVYLSRTKNTKALAQMIEQRMGGTLLELELVNPYPENYKAIVDQVAKENEKGFLPPLKTKVDIGKFDVVFIGFPTWGMQLPPPMKSFLTQYNLAGKTLVPFNTNAGYGMGNSLETIKKLCPQSIILEAFSTKGGVERDGILFVMEKERKKQVQDQIEEWLKKINLIK